MRRTKLLLGVVVIGLVAFRWSPYLWPLHERDLGHVTGRLVRFYDGEQRLIGSVITAGNVASQPVSLRQISPNVVRAFLAAEDKRFYSHGGVDAMALMRATLQNLRARRIVSGGSTLTMQLARLLRPKRRSVIGKVSEVYTAWRLEAGMTKEKILRAYLNRVPMGGNLIGVGAAAEVYFGVPVSRLNVTQAAFLASIPKSPSRRDPLKDPQSLEKRRAYVLRAMQEMPLPRSLSPGQRRLQLETQYSPAARVRVNSRGKTLNAYHLFFHALNSVKTESPKVTLTVDPDVQRMVAEQVKQRVARLKERRATNAAALVLENQTGRVLAYVGSVSYYDTEHQGRVDGVQALRQPGSALKPFLYAAALGQGYTPATVLPDVPVSFPGEEEPYEPENFSNAFHGPVRVRIALANSLNVPAIQVASRMGIPSVLSTLHSFGFSSLKESADYYGLGLVLGGGEVTLYEMARAYMALANGGVLREPRVLADSEGPRNHAPEERQVADSRVRSDSRVRIDRETAYLITDILSDQQARALEFGQDCALNLPFPCAVKTGTSSRFRDNWTVGYTTEHTVAVWVGNFDGSPMEEVAGVAGAGPLFARIMVNLYRKRPLPRPFNRPSGLVLKQVCSLSGRRPNPHCPHVVEEWFTQTGLEGYGSHQCKWHREVTVDNRSGDVATSACPSAYRQEQTRVFVPREFQVRKGDQGNEQGQD